MSNSNNIELKEAQEQAIASVHNFVGISPITDHNSHLLVWLHAYLKGEELCDAQERADAIHHYEMLVELLDGFTDLQQLRLTASQA